MKAWQLQSHTFTSFRFWPSSMRSIRLLIDGYNLLFQSEWVGRGRAQGWLPRSRERLLKALADQLDGEDQSRTTVVFDAAKFGETPADFNFNHIDVRFAKEHDEADDLLELLIRQAPQPKLLNVVSSDLRIRRCATARRAHSIDSENFLRQVEAGRVGLLFKSSGFKEADSPEPETPEKELGTNDVDFWLREFDC